MPTCPEPIEKLPTSFTTLHEQPPPAVVSPSMRRSCKLVRCLRAVSRFHNLSNRSRPYET